MKAHLLPAIRLTLVCLVFFSGFYTLFVWGASRLAPDQGQGSQLTVNGRTYYRNIGQVFNQDRYFWSRPSAVAYNAAGAAGSNKGPTNPAYLAEVQARIDTFLAHNPGVRKAAIPADLVTASGSGLDPDISVQAARVQVQRIAHLRHLDPAAVQELITRQTRQPLLQCFGPEKINVLQLNLALDQLK